jgi:large subunit ribosomal protein L10
LAHTRERKEDLVAQYEEWLKTSRAIFLTEYTGLDMPAIDALRSRVREAGGEFHIIKNTLGKLAFDSAGFEMPEDYLMGSTAIGIAFDDPPAVAKALADFSEENQSVKIKGGFLAGDHMQMEQVIRLATLPPLPVVRGQFLALLMTPATQLTRLLAEPGRQLAQVIKAYADSGAAGAGEAPAAEVADEAPQAEEVPHAAEAAEKAPQAEVVAEDAAPAEEPAASEKAVAEPAEAAEEPADENNESDADAEDGEAADS